MQISKCALALGLLVLGAAAQAQVKGPDPSAASIAADGPFAVTATSVARGNGFGGGTIYVPNTAGSYAVVAFCPGFTATQSSIQVMGRRLATHGFVVLTMNTNSTSDQPPSRATQLVAALNRAVTLAGSKADTNRRGVTGHSMGGGGTLLALRSNPSLRGGVGLAPWSSNTKNFSAVTNPAAIVGGSGDTVAPPNNHSTRFYNSMNQNEKLLAIISGADHFFPQDNPANQPASKYQIAWFKRFLDGDTRYSQFLVNDNRLSTFASTAPF